MPKCRECGKKFSTLSALREHHRALHSGQRFVAPTSTLSRNLVVSVTIVIIVIGSLATYLIYSQPQTSTTADYIGVTLNQPISSSLYDNLTGVSFSTLTSIGSGGISSSTVNRISGSAFTSEGKPGVLYIGAEYCPFCGAERWSMIVALSKFGNFSNIGYMLSSSTDTFANTATFSFLNSTYTSNYISFVSVEYEDRNRAPLQTVSSSDQTLWSQYDTSGSIPFMDIGNQYAVVGAQYEPSTISGLNWTQIASQLNNPNSVVAKAIDGSANALITAICKIDGGSPSSVCGQSFATIPLSLVPSSRNSTGDSFLILDSISETSRLNAR